MEPVEPLSPLDTRSSTFSLPDGRCIGYCVQGPDTGTPIIWLHGMPGCRLETLAYAKVAVKLNCRLIGIDRPGIGLSSPLASRNLREYVSDVAALADHLELSTFRILGGSGGGPYALACAAALPQDRLLATGIAVGLGPVAAARETMGLVPYLTWSVLPKIPGLVRWYVARKVREDSIAALAQLQEGTEAGLGEQEHEPESESTTELVTDKVTTEAIVREWSRQGVDGFAQDGLVLARPWDFDLSDVHGRVRLWYAGTDWMAPPEIGRWIKERLENAELTVYEDATHGTVMSRYGQEIFEQLLAEGSA